MEEIQNRFVLDDEFGSSTTRVRNWFGFNKYLEAWDRAEEQLGVRVLLGVWIAGSFITREPNPSDIDISPIYDAKLLPTLAGMPGKGPVAQLLGSRDWLKRHFYVEPFPLGWKPTGSSLFPEKLPSGEQQYLLLAGGLTDFWQREKRSEIDGSPLHANQYAYKGFLEVFR
jgi:hypothetical protein